MNTVQEPLTSILPPPCSIENPPERIHSGLPTIKGNAETNANFDSGKVDTNPLPDRCQFTFSDGRQCRMERSDIHPSRCRFHAQREDQLFGEPSSFIAGASLDLPELYSACGDLTTAAGVHRALAQVFRLLAQRRISRQEAATFGHLAQLLLRSISSARAESVRPVSSVFRTPLESSAVAITEIGVPSSGGSRQPDELPPVNKGKRESRDLPVPTPLNQAESERNEPFLSRAREVAHAASPPSLQVSHPQHLAQTRPQLVQNEHLPNFSA
jgi:hypothetical protein